MILSGKYSLLSKDAKLFIDKYHMTNVRPIQIHGILYPNDKQDVLGKKSPIEYASENYGLPIKTLEKLGEIGSVYDKMQETLLINIEDVCHFDT